MAECTTIGTSTLTTVLGPLGNGVTLVGGISLSAGHPERPEDDDGSFLYIRDCDRGTLWSATYYPTRVAPDVYEFRSGPDLWQIDRLNFGIRTRWTVSLRPDIPLEQRACWVRNESDVVRKLELTYALVPVLQPWSQHAAHPAFSRLFLETERLSAGQGILIRRRPRELHEVTWKAAAFTLGESHDPTWGSLSLETSRARFLGRGRSMQCPIACESGGPLSGTVGPVLDPVLALRRIVTLMPGQSTTVTFGLAAETDEEVVRECAARTIRESLPHDVFHELSGDGTHESNGHPVSIPSHDCAWIFDRAPAHPNGVAGSGSSKAQGDAIPVHTSDLPLAGISETQPRPPVIPTATGDDPLGEFGPDGRSYVIHIRPDEQGGWRLPPMPWTHIVANDAAGFIVSE
ncbi:MAG TPA: hypothetical protein VIY86_14660, partial [Pirellulaceae bacterium]